MNENKWIDNPWITIIECVGANSWDGKMRWILITKTTMVVNFSPTEEIFQVNGKSWQVANLPVVDFHSQPREMVTLKPLNV